MSLRHVSGGYLQRYTSGSADGIPQYGGGTVCGWFTRRVDRNANSCLLLLRGEGTTGQYAGLYTGPGDDTMLVSTSAGDSPAMPITISNDEPFFAALMISGAYVFGAFASDSSDSLHSTAIAIGSDPQFNMVRIGDDGYGSWFDGESCGVMAFSRLIGVFGLWSLRRFRTPIDRTDLLFWLPEIDPVTAANNRLDYSGAQRHFTVVGSPVAADGSVRNWSLNR